MKRITVYVTEQEFTALHVMAEARGLKFAEILRRILDKAIEDERERLRREE